MTLLILEENVAAHENPPEIQSYCSDKATARGGNQSVVAFTFFEAPVQKHQLYFFGVARNAEDVPRFYPNWTMRVYHNAKADDFLWSAMKALEIAFPLLDFCNTSALPMLGKVEGASPTIWRYIPMGDPLVKQFVSRDLDTYIIPREAEAVREWLASNLTFHLMRDHRYHGYHVLAGMWGAKRYRNPTLMDNLLKRILLRSKSRESDQEILKAVVWPEMKGDVLQHDSYFCRRYRSHGNVRPFPFKRVGNLFPGFRITEDPEKRLKKCPRECRPRKHEDWEFC